jgi:hypothetical protein
MLSRSRLITTVSLPVYPCFARPGSKVLEGSSVFRTGVRIKGLAPPQGSRLIG